LFFGIVEFSWYAIVENGIRKILDGFKLPSPTTFRAVSGSVKITKQRHRLEIITRNQNIAVQSL
jgi:hypothetical protein